MESDQRAFTDGFKGQILNIQIHPEGMAVIVGGEGRLVAVAYTPQMWVRLKARIAEIDAQNPGFGKSN